ncbi:hypothetical protein COO60DRAFT_1623841 [Scenedesmus sp. NREL 46B-D3]|nr:hypothetical protein COO60DRAFT_1623841 [Scenedesmus sp. NREL 46B-D3]
MAAAAAIAAVLLMGCTCTAPGALRVVANIFLPLVNNIGAYKSGEQTSASLVKACSALLDDQGSLGVVTCPKAHQTGLRHSYKLRTMHQQQHHQQDRGGSTWLLGTGAVAVATAATLFPPPASMWLPVAGIALAVGLLAVLAPFILSQLRGDAAGPSNPSSLNPSQALELVKTRRSVYPKDMTGNTGAITGQQLEMMLDAARWAPTHKLTECWVLRHTHIRAWATADFVKMLHPWHFVVLSGAGKAAFEQLTIDLCQQRLAPEKAEATVAKLRRKQAKDWPKVHCYIAICMKRHEEVPEWEEVAAVGCAVQNMALVGSSMGVHGYWSSWQPAARDAPEMHALLQIDASKGDRCLGVFVAGQGQQERLESYRPRRQELAEKVLWLK